MRKRIMMMLAVLLVATLTGVAQTTIYTIEDAYIKSDEAEVNFGDDEALWARDQTRMQQSYIKFDTSGLGTVTNIDAISGYAYDIAYDRTAAVYLMTNSSYMTWSENSITWSNAPGNNLGTRYLFSDAGLLVGTIATPVANGSLDVAWNDAGSEAAVMNAMNTQDSITLVLIRPGDRYAKFASKESTDENASPFQMVIETVPMQTTPSALVVSQDATIKPDPDADTNFGSSETLTASDAGMDMSYVQFDSPASPVVDISSLSAFAMASSTPRGSAVYLATDDISWDQSTITWNNAPANNPATKYPDVSGAVKIGTFPAAAVGTAETVPFAFDDTTLKQLLINRMNSFDSVSLIIVRSSDRSVAYASLENGSTAGAHPIQMDFTVEGAAATDPYGDWSDLYGGVELIGSADNDYDGDNISNLGEYALNGNPTNALDKGQAAILIENSVFNYVHAKNTNDASLIYRLIDMQDLVTVLSPGTNNWDSQSMGPGTGDYVMVTNSYSMTTDTLFLELEVEQQQ